MIDNPYNAADWHWIIAGDNSQAWSSAERAYVNEWPADRVSRIASLAELAEVLENAGCADLAPLNANHVRRECQRRIIALMGARDLSHCMVKQLNANMRANELNDKRVSGETLTAEEQAEADYLRAMATEVKRLRAKSNEMEPNPPANYAADSRWA